jgi:hypothetical protein
MTTFEVKTKKPLMKYAHILQENIGGSARRCTSLDCSPHNQEFEEVVAVRPVYK